MTSPTPDDDALIEAVTGLGETREPGGDAQAAADELSVWDCDDVDLRGGRDLGERL